MFGIRKQKGTDNDLKEAIEALVKVEMVKLSKMSNEELLRYYAEMKVSVSQVYILVNGTLACFNDIVEQSGMALSHECRSKLEMLTKIASGELPNT